MGSVMSYMYPAFYAPKQVAKKFLDYIHDEYRQPAQLTLDKAQEQWRNHIKRYCNEYHIITDHDTLLREDIIQFVREEELTYFLLKWG